jgi:hypothetical protein
MRIPSPIAPVIVLALAMAGCGGDDEQAAATAAGADVAPITVQLQAENDSGRSGDVRLEPDGDDAMLVVVTISDGPTKTNPAHIHNVTCESYRAMDDFSDQLGTVEDTLKTLRDGASETKVSVPLAERATGGYSINVHEPAEPFPVVACADIPKR